MVTRLIVNLIRKQEFGILTARTMSSQSTTGYTAEYFEKKIRSELPASHVDIVDVSCGCGSKFESVIVSEQFKGKSLIQRHRMVNSLISDELKAIHAFSMKTLTPEQFTEAAAGKVSQ